MNPAEKKSNVVCSNKSEHRTDWKTRCILLLSLVNVFSCCLFKRVIFCFLVERYKFLIMLCIFTSQIVRNVIYYLAWSFLFQFLIFFPNGTDSCARKSVFGKSNFLPVLALSKRPLTNNGHFPLVKVAVIERLDCTWIINTMLSGPFCIRGYHFTAKLHQIKIWLPAQIIPFRFSQSVEFLIKLGT